MRRLSTTGFKAQLGPFAQEVKRQGIATFAWTQGLNEVYPPDTFVNNFGVGKLYKFIETDTIFDQSDPETLRDFPADAGTAEDTLRQLVTVRDRYPLVSEWRRFDEYTFCVCTGDWRNQGCTGESRNSDRPRMEYM
ncbi:hypothetical protein QBC44DRAFT_372900 [Cladorrhinum sp. PSN332]|nr:hypothetical protein QBC44DRAFT_372900 [Cladorrhinum sp. PSN332]